MITEEQRRWRLAHRHRLTSEGHIDDVAQITDDLVALHSSDPATVFLSALVRMKNPAVDSIERALYKDRSVVRHHAMRRTLWVMTPEVARLAHGSATHKVARAETARTIAALADTTDIADPASWLANAKAEVVALLETQGSLTTREIGRVLPHLVLPVTFGVGTKNPAALNAHTKVLQGAAFEALVVRGQPGGWNSSEYPWMATEQWLGHEIAGLHESQAAGPLLDRWLLRFGPATLTDIRWWFGWTANLAKQALVDSEAQEVEVENSATGFVASADDDADDSGPWVRLLPGLDPTAMGWRERDWYLNPGDTPVLFDRFGNAGPTIWADGRVVGGWVQRADGGVAVELTAALDQEHQRLLGEAISELVDCVGDVVVRPRFPAPIQKQLTQN